jgi:hypothetical protein
VSGLIGFAPKALYILLLLQPLAVYSENYPDYQYPDQEIYSQFPGPAAGFRWRPLAGEKSAQDSPGFLYQHGAGYQAPGETPGYGIPQGSFRPLEESEHSATQLPSGHYQFRKISPKERARWDKNRARQQYEVRGSGQRQSNQYRENVIDQPSYWAPSKSSSPLYRPDR